MTSKERCSLYVNYRYIAQRCIQNTVKQLRRSFFWTLVYEYKPLGNYFCKKSPSWVFERVLIMSMKFMWYYIFYAIVVSKKWRLSATLAGVEALIKKLRFMGMNFSTRSQTKISPSKAITYPRHFFVDKETKR